MKIELELNDPQRTLADLSAAIEATGNGQVSRRLGVLHAYIEDQLPKPRIPEPSKWGVVEAHHDVNALRRRYVHIDPDEWVCVESGYFYSWPDLVDPVLIREGI